MTAIVVNEPPPLDLCVLVETPGNVRTRWSWDDPNPDLVPTNMTFGTAMPGGFTQCSITLERAPERFYGDDRELSKLTVLGAGGTVAWQGRIEKLPDTAGYEAQESPEAVGYQAALEDDNSVREIYVDAELSKWEAATIEQKLELLKGSTQVFTVAPTVGVSSGADSGPALILALTGTWAMWTRATSTYMGNQAGIPTIGALTYAAKLQEKNKIGDVEFNGAGWECDAYAATGKSLITELEATGAALGTISGDADPPTVLLQHAPTYGTSGVEYPVFFTVLAVYGTHGLTQCGTNSTTEWKGLLASDVVAHALGKWAPEIAFSTGPEGTIKPSSFIVPQLAFLEPTTVAEVIKQATRFELPDWAVWEGPTLYMNPRGERGRKWQARVGPSQLQESGPQISRLWNGVCVQYTDVTGKQRMVGPPGFAGGTSETEDSNLLETNPENPLNELGIRKWALLKMGTSTVEGAKAVGRIYLQEQKARELQGQAALIGYVEDEQGTSWPAWMVRAGDTIRFVDASITAPRTIVNTSYDDTTKTNTISLEQPPENMQALLERLAVSIENVATS